MSEIRLRAITQIGKISRELEKAQYNKGPGTVVPSGGNYKAGQLKAAGISTSTANEYEQLAAPSEELTPVFGAAMENYFDEQAANKEVPTVRGLRGAIKESGRRGGTRTLTQAEALGLFANEYDRAPDR